MAEAALHLLPHLFMPHDDDHHRDSHHHQHDDGLGDSCKLIALGFLTAFAIDRFAGGRKKKPAETAVPAMEASVAGDATERDGAGVADDHAAQGGVDNDTVVAESPSTPTTEATVAIEATARDGEGTANERTSVGDVEKESVAAESPAPAAITSGGPTSAGDGDKEVVASAPPDAEHNIDRKAKTDPAAAGIPAVDSAVTPVKETIDVADECVSTAASTTTQAGDEESAITAVISSPPAPATAVATTAKDGESEMTEASNSATAGEANSSIDPGTTGASTGQVGEVPPATSGEQEERPRESALSSGAEYSAATAVLASAHLRTGAAELASGDEVSISKPLPNEEKQPQENSVHLAEAEGSAPPSESTKSVEPSKPSELADSARSTEPAQSAECTDTAAEPATPEPPISSLESAAEAPEEPKADATDTVVATPSSESVVHEPELTLYGNPRTPAAVPKESAPIANGLEQDDTSSGQSSGACLVR